MVKQLTDFEGQFIVLFNEKHPTWGLSKCAEILPKCFSHISRDQFPSALSHLSEFTASFLGNLYIPLVSFNSHHHAGKVFTTPTAYPGVVKKLQKRLLPKWILVNSSTKQTYIHNLYYNLTLTEVYTFETKSEKYLLKLNQKLWNTSVNITDVYTSMKSMWFFFHIRLLFDIKILQ